MAAIAGTGGKSRDDQSFLAPCGDLQERDPAGDALIEENLHELSGRFTPEERMELVGPGLYMAPVRYKQVMNTTTERARGQVAAEVVTEFRHPIGYAEGTRQGNPQKDQMEGNSRQRGKWATYESQLIRRRGELTKISQEIEWHGGEENGNFGLGASTWSIEDIWGGEFG